MKPRWSLTTAFLFFIFTMGQAFPQAPNVSEIVIQGNKSIATDAILSTIQTRVGEPFSVTTMNADLARIRRMGYFYEESVNAMYETTPEGVRVTFVVEEHPVIQQIVITGNTVLPEPELRNVLTSKVGDVMNSAVVAKDREAIRNLYRTRGYVADVGASDPEQLISRDGTLTFPIIIAVVEAIEITGNRKTKTNVIRREMRTEAGEPFNTQRLQRDLERIYNLDIFEEVGPIDTALGSEPGRVIIRLPVKEKKTGQVSLGVGYSGPQGVVGRIELAETNFRGRGEGVNLLLELGGRAGRTSYEVGFYEPYLLGSRTSVSASVYNKVVYRFSNSAISGPAIPSEDRDLFNEIRQGGQITFTRPFGERNRGILGLRSEDIRLNVDAQNPNLPQFVRQQGRISTLSLRGIRDTRDIIIDPARGEYYSSSVDFGNADVEPNIKGNFTRASMDLRRYLSSGVRAKPTDKKTVLAGRLIVGTMGGEIPFSEQFFVGGAETLRGYLESRFWGKNMFLANVEYRKPIANAFQGVAFIDVGDAWGTGYDLPTTADPTGRFDQDEGFDAHIGAGLGIRVTTPIGPLRLDWGFGKEGSRAHFSIGHVF